METGTGNGGVGVEFERSPDRVQDLGGTGCVPVLLQARCGWR
jgi:hypothetical protein